MAVYIGSSKGSSGRRRLRAGCRVGVPYSAEAGFGVGQPWLRRVDGKRLVGGGKRRVPDAIGVKKAASVFPTRAGGRPFPHREIRLPASFERGSRSWRRCRARRSSCPQHRDLTELAVAWNDSYLVESPRVAGQPDHRRPGPHGRASWVAGVEVAGTARLGLEVWDTPPRSG